MDLRKLKTLIELVSESSITELEVTEEDTKVRIVRGSPAAIPMQTQIIAPTNQAPIPHSFADTPVAPKAAAENTAGVKITSPMVGTYYSAPSPGADPFVKVGSTVQAGDTLCIIEAMKILNEIEAEQAGVITQIFASNGDPIEYGQPLFIIE